MLTALITGSNGFIGYLSKLLLENNWNVIGVDTNTPYYDVTLNKRESVLKEFSNFQSFENSIEDKIFDNHSKFIQISLYIWRLKSVLDTYKRT